MLRYGVINSEHQPLQRSLHGPAASMMTSFPNSENRHVIYYQKSWQTTCVKGGGQIKGRSRPLMSYRSAANTPCRRRHHAAVNHTPVIVNNIGAALVNTTSHCIISPAVCQGCVCSAGHQGGGVSLLLDSQQHLMPLTLLEGARKGSVPITSSWAALKCYKSCLVFMREATQLPVFPGPVAP